MRKYMLVFITCLLIFPAVVYAQSEQEQNIFRLFESIVTFEDWLVYPMLSGNLGVAGSFYADLSLDEPRLVRLAFLGEHHIIAGNLGDLLLKTANEDQPFPRWLVLERQPESAAIYSIEFGTDTEPDSFIRLDFTDKGVVTGVEAVNYWEGAESLEFMLARVGEPDPRLQFMRCEGAAISRLEIGGRGQVFLFFEETLPIRDYPPGTANGQLKSGTAFTVLAGPTCFESGAWWQIRTDEGRTGWISESDGLSYNTFPLANNP